MHQSLGKRAFFTLLSSEDLQYQTGKFTVYSWSGFLCCLITAQSHWWGKEPPLKTVLVPAVQCGGGDAVVVHILFKVCWEQNICKHKA